MADSKLVQTFSDSFAPNGQFQPWALVLPPLRERFRMTREAALNDAKDKAMFRQIQERGVLGGQAQTAIKEQGPQAQSALGQEIGQFYGGQTPGAEPNAINFPGIQGTYYTGPGATEAVQTDTRARTALGLGEQQIAERQKAGQEADKQLPVPLALLNGMTPEQRTITRAAFAQALGTTNQENARAQYMTGQVNARAKYAFDLTNEKDLEANRASFRMLRDMRDKGVLSPPLAKAASAILDDAALPPDSPAFSAMFNIVSKANFPVTTVTLTGSADQKATTAQLEEDLAATQQALQRLDQVADNFDADYLTYLGQGRAAAGSFLEKAFKTPIDKEYRSRFTTMVTAAALNFNLYVKMLTGAQMSAPEVERYKASYPNDSDSATVFAAKFMLVCQMTRDHANLVESQLKRGVNPINNPEVIDEQKSLVRQYGTLLESVEMQSDPDVKALMKATAGADIPPPPQVTPEQLQKMTPEQRRKLADKYPDAPWKQ